MSYARREDLAEGIVVYQGDCREVLPGLGKVDAVVTDPPYGIDYGRAGGFSASHGWGNWRQNVKWDNERPSEDVFLAIMAISKEQVIWGGNYFADLLPPRMRWLVWDKGQRDFSLADVELAWTSQNKAARAITYARPRALRDGKEHPTQKPIDVMAWCLGFLPDAKTILAPFMGSGTTGVACVQLGRKFIGIELDSGYFDIACRRISDELKRPRLPLDQPRQPSATQEALSL